MARNYAAEYARRVSNARERAADQGRPFSLREARGHTSREGQEARINRSVRAAQAEGGLSAAQAKGLRRAAHSGIVNGLSEQKVKELIAQRGESEAAAKSGNRSLGRDRWFDYVGGDDSWFPVEFFSYGRD